ncbi:MAG: STAS domain-containing protein [Arenicellales bacterium]
MAKQKHPSATVELSDSGLSFSGVMNHQSVPKLIAHLPKYEHNPAVLDISQVSKIDSAGLAFLIDWGNQNLSDNNPISLRGASKQAQQMINIMGLDGVFELLN